MKILKMYRTLLSLGTVMLLSSCSFYGVDDYYDPSELHTVVKNSQETIQLRKQQAENFTLEQKAEIFETRLKKTFHQKYIFIPKLFDENPNPPLRIDTTALLLSALAFKYSVTQNEQDKNLISKMVDSLISADEANGFDGFLPYKVRIKNDTIVPIDNKTRENVYAQLFFAYTSILNYVSCPEIHEKVIQHSRFIITHFAKHDFKLINHEGKESPHADLSPTQFSILNNRKLSLLYILDLGLKFCEDKVILNKLQQTRERAVSYGYLDEILELHTVFLNLEFPTQSSSWLNMLKIYNGWSASQNNVYKMAYDRLILRYADEDNLFLNLSVMLFTNENHHQKLPACWQRFPLT